MRAALDPWPRVQDRCLYSIGLVNPAMTPLAHLLSAAQRRLDAQDFVGARILYEEILALQPNHLGGLRRIATLLLSTAPATAIDYAGRLVNVQPNNAEALGLLGQALSAAGRAWDAVAPFRDAAQLAPNSATYQCNLALSLLRAGSRKRRCPSSNTRCRSTRCCSRRRPIAAIFWSRCEEPDAAMDSYRAVFARRPDDPDALHGVAMAQRLLGQPTATAAALVRAAWVAPNWVNAQVDLGVVLSEKLGRPTARWRPARRAVAIAPDNLGYASNLLFALQYQPDMKPEAATAEACAWAPGCAPSYRVGRCSRAPRVMAESCGSAMSLPIFGVILWAGWARRRSRRMTGGRSMSRSTPTR